MLIEVVAKTRFKYEIGLSEGVEGVEVGFVMVLECFRLIVSICW